MLPLNRYLPSNPYTGVGLGQFGMNTMQDQIRTMFNLEQDRNRMGQQVLEGQLYLAQLRNQEQPGAFQRARRLLMGY